jgi:glutamine cyclotransferase
VGSGRYGESTLRKLDFENNITVLNRSLDSSYFGEGITVYNDSVIQLTWLKGTGFVYHKEDFCVTGQFQYYGEGWGLTHDSERLIMSDGSSNLYFLDPNTFKEIGCLTVKVGKKPLKNLNELEYVEGEIFANILNSDWIARIDILTGQVVGWIRADNLLSQEEKSRGAGVLNGIAYDPVSSRLFLTGKLWPKIFEVSLIPVQ